MISHLPESILYVDDDDDSRHAFGWLFRRAGFDVMEAATGAEALRLARAKPDLVVLDVNLPDINGFDVCREIKAHPATASIPVLHLSAYFISSEDRAHGLEGGADGYLTKPIEPDELVAQIRALLRIHRAEEAAHAAARQWQAMFDALSDGVCLLDLEGRIRRCNKAMAHFLGKPFADIIGKPYHALLREAPGLADASFFARVRDLCCGDTIEVCHGEHWYRVSVDPVHEAEGLATGSVHLYADITAMKQLEDRLRQAQKMEAVGRLAGGIAHDFNNLLTTITGNASLMLAALPTADPGRAALDMIEKAAWRGADLTHQLLEFSGHGMLVLKPTDLNRSVEEVLDLLRRTFDPRVTVAARLDPDLWAAGADAPSMRDVLMNLCLNARDAMPQGGRLLLETSNHTVLDEETACRAEARAGEFVRLRVHDTGTGIRSDVLPRIFEPFFTTKDVGTGTGLGLAMAFGIVKQHEGWIECASTVDEGACFDVYVPRLRAPAPSALSAPPRSGGATILLVDDEPMIRDVARLILEGAGYQVLPARDGREGLEIYRRERQRIKLVILDATMPKLSGPETLRELLNIDSSARVLFASGYSAVSVPPVDGKNVMGFIAKPYGAGDLAAQVRAALDAKTVESV